MLEPYPPGQWRLSRHELQDVLLTVSHIVLMHEDVSPQFDSVTAVGWHVAQRSTRTRFEAQRLAARAALDASREPARFAQLAMLHSDDSATRNRGGSLGTCPASHLPEQFLDALAYMKPGDVSRVIETELGFHVLLMRPPPKEERVSADHILVAHKWTEAEALRPGRTRERSRDEASLLARDIARRATRNPTSFADLVREHSDHADALRGGDIGVWSTHDVRAAVFRPGPSTFQREIEAISKLPIGGISEPIETALGFSIFRRKEVTGRSAFAVNHLILPYGARGRMTPRGEVKALAVQIQHQLREDPERLPDLQAKYCCSGTTQWASGRGDPTFEAELAALDIGAFSKPIDAYSEFHILRRVPPAPPTPNPDTVFALPRPIEPDIEYFVRSANADALRDYVGSLEAIVDEFAATHNDTLRNVVARNFEQLEAGMKSPDGNERLKALLTWRANVRAALGDKNYRLLRERLLHRIVADLSPELAVQSQNTP